MEGKVVIMMSAVLVVAVLGQIHHQVEAQTTLTSCCQSSRTREVFNTCRFVGGSQSYCASASGCRLVNGNCPSGWTFDTLQNTAPIAAAGDDAVNEYCKSGCVSSVCTAIATLQDSDASEVVNGAIEKCTDACTDFCTKKASVIKTAVETA